MRAGPHLARLIRIVALTPATRHRLDRIAPEVFDARPDGAALSAYIADPAQRCFLALDADLVVGQIKTVLHRHPEKDPNIYIEELGVSPDWQRRGIAARLLAEAEAFARAAGCAEIWLATELDNTAANAFYRARGLVGQQVMMWSRVF